MYRTEEPVLRGGIILPRQICSGFSIQSSKWKEHFLPKRQFCVRFFFFTDYGEIWYSEVTDAKKFFQMNLILISPRTLFCLLQTVRPCYRKHHVHLSTAGKCSVRYCTWALGPKEIFDPCQLSSHRRLVHLLLCQFGANAVPRSRHHGTRRRVCGGARHHLRRRDQPTKAERHSDFIFRQAVVT